MGVPPNKHCDPASHGFRVTNTGPKAPNPPQFHFKKEKKTLFFLSKKTLSLAAGLFAPQEVPKEATKGW